MRPWVVKWSAGGIKTAMYEGVGIGEFAQMCDANAHAQAWAQAATGNVAMLRTSFSGADKCFVVPAVGQKCAIAIGSDRRAFEVCEVRPNGRTILIQRDDEILQARKQFDGFYKLWGAGHKSYVIFTSIEDYFDPHR